MCLENVSVLENVLPPTVGPEGAKSEAEWGSWEEALSPYSKDMSLGENCNLHGVRAALQPLKGFPHFIT